MRTTRMALVGSAIIMLIGGVASVGLAEDQAADGPVAHVTGTIVDTSYDDSMAKATTAPGDVHLVEGASYVETNTWDDPRLPVEKRMVLNFATYPDAGGRMMVTRTSIRLDGPDGAWVGTGVGLSYPDGHSEGQDVLIGQGAYEGLIAVLHCGTEKGCTGVIVEGEMPAQPDPVPPAE